MLLLGRSFVNVSVYRWDGKDKLPKVSGPTRRRARSAPDRGQRWRASAHKTLAHLYVLVLNVTYPQPVDNMWRQSLLKVDI